jgi:hypothetical protein
VYGVLIDTCEENDKRSWPQCFNTRSGTLFSGRWLYIALQGVALGIFLDIILEGIVRSVVNQHSIMHNATTLKDREDYYIGHVYGYLWMGWFMWFALLAFVYIPFGAWIQTFQKAILGEDWVNDWVPGLIAMDTALVTPLIVTQLLKLITDTFIPYIVRLITEKAKLQTTGKLDLGKPIDVVNVEDYRDPLVEHDDEKDNDQTLARLLSADNPMYSLLSAVQKDQHLSSKVYITDTIPTWGFDKTQQRMVRMWKTATHILEESKRSDFDVFSEMLRPVIQLSYVTNFSSVWPLAPLCAYLNNIFEVKGDAFKMLVGNRRQIPRKVNGIGAWNGCLMFSAIAGVFFMVGLVCIASSGLESFLLPEGCDLHDDDWVMRPNLKCLGEDGTRVVSALILEHIGLFILFLVYNGIDERSKWAKGMEVKSMMNYKREFETHWLLRGLNPTSKRYGAKGKS